MTGIIKVTFEQCIKTIIKTKRQQKIPPHCVKLTHQLSFRNVNLKSEHPSGGKWFHPRPQRPQGELVTKPETLLLIILSLVCKHDIKEVHGNKSIPVFKKKVLGWKHQREVDNCRNSSPYIGHFILSKYWQHPVQDIQCRKGQAAIGPFPSVNTNKQKWHTPSIRLLKVNHISMYSTRGDMLTIHHDCKLGVAFESNHGYV